MPRVSLENQKVKFPFQGTRVEIQDFLRPYQLTRKTYNFAYRWIQVLSTRILTWEEVEWLMDNEGCGPGQIDDAVDEMCRKGLIAFLDVPEFPEDLRHGPN